MFQTKVVQEIKIHILCSVTFSRNSCRLWDTAEKYGTARQATDDITIWRMRFACWIKKATDTHSQHVTFIAFPQQQWLHERASMLRYTYIASLIALYRRGIQFWKLHPQTYSANITTCNDSNQNGPLQGAGRGKQYGRHIRRMWRIQILYLSTSSSQNKQTARSQF